MDGTVTHTLVRALRKVDDLAGLEDEALLEAVGDAANLRWPAGSVVFEPGEPGDAVYLVLTGLVRIRDGDVELADIGPGGYFGEQAAMLRTTHSATAQAVEDSELMVIPQEPFKRLLDRDPKVAERVRRTMERRLEERGQATSTDSDPD